MVLFLLLLSALAGALAVPLHQHSIIPDVSEEQDKIFVIAKTPLQGPADEAALIRKIRKFTTQEDITVDIYSDPTIGSGGSGYNDACSSCGSDIRGYDGKSFSSGNYLNGYDAYGK